MARDDSDAPRTGWRRFVNGSTAGVTLLAVALVASLWQVAAADRELTGTADETVIRVCHWQLEAGFRDALQAVIDDYEKLQASRGRKVRVVQMAVTERVYAQWLNTQLISGTAPDLCASGKSRFTTDDQYTLRFFQPLGQLITQVNPYNDGTPLAGLPWRDTLRDGARSGYRQSLLEFYAVPTTLVGQRLFVNKTLLKEVTGTDAPPKTFGELVALGPKVDAHAARVKKPIRTLGTPYFLSYFFGRYQVAMTASLEPLLDADLDGAVTPLETYAGYLAGKVGFDTPQVKAYYEMMGELSRLMGPGHAAIDRQQAQFNFVQGRTILLGSGSWDAEGLRGEFAKKGWELGVIDYVIPAPGEQWGELTSGRSADGAIGGGVPLSLYKLSRHQDVATDFLMYLTSRDANEKYTRLANWPPVTVGATPSELMAPFVPNPLGFTSRADFNIGNEVQSTLSGQEGLLFNNEIGYEEMAAKVDRTIRDPAAGGDRAWAIEYDRVTRDTRNQERVLAVQAARALLDPAAKADADAKFRRALLQQVRKNNGADMKKRFEDLRGKPIPPV